MGGMLLRQWIEPLALKPEQIEALRPAIERTARELSELRRENLRASQEVITAFERRVVEQLTPEQVQAFEKLREERRERWRRFQDRPRREDAPRREEAPPSRGVNRPRPEPQPKD
jgi:Spy/CpxP family protein refolding chaperone